MSTKQPFLNAMMYIAMFRELDGGEESRPRGLLIKEIEDAMIDFDMSVPICMSFTARNMSLKYACNEFLWYLRGNPYDRSIEKHATMWPKIIQPEGLYFSNYGQYMFGVEGFDWVCNSLIADPDSRQAAFPLLRPQHCFPGNKDMVCTYSISFRIRQNMLNMSVNMRSNDAIYGLTNDAFCFAMFYEMVYARLCSNYPTLERGKYVHKVDSLHVYERHFPMVKKILAEGLAGYLPIFIPEISTQGESMDLNRVSFEFENVENKAEYISTIPPERKFTKWILQSSM